MEILFLEDGHKTAQKPYRETAHPESGDESVKVAKGWPQGHLLHQLH